MGLSLLLQQTTVQTAPNAAELRNEIQQTVREATAAARQAAADAKAQNGAGSHISLQFPPPPTSTTIGVPDNFDRDMPPRVKDVSIAFIVMVAFAIVALPLVRAIARRIDRGSQAPPPIPKEVRDQLLQISQSVDAIAIEVERISEGQRFATKMLAENKPQDITMLTQSSSGQ